MMRKIVRIPFVVLGILLLAGFKSLAGGIETTHGFKSWGFFQLGNNFTTTDTKFENPSVTWTDITNNSVKDIVSLRVNDKTYIPYAFDYTVTVNIDYYTTPYGSPQTLTGIPLHVTYNPGQGTTYKGLDSYTLPAGIKAYKLKVTIASLTANSGSVVPDGRMLELTTDIVVDRTYQFQSSLPIGPTYNATSTQLQMIWPQVQGAEEYDVEWTTINNGNPDFTTINTNGADMVNALPRVFRNNASRITTPGQTDTISILSTDDVLLVRIRQVQYTPDGLRQTGDWDYKQANASYAVWQIASSWHQPNLNWQYSSAFAEQGKKKEVISYFDGTLRGRQTVTINNSDHVGVAQENIYDEFGRPAASILPAPYKETSGGPFLHYLPGFNLNTSGTPYTFSNVLGSNCELNPDPLGTASGAARYYSINNPFTYASTQSKHDFVPDAAGYPLSVTQYTADNTGRIKVQGVVGPTFQPGKASTGDNSKTTKYYYGKPEQWELDQLFGSDAGYAEHYLKNMVVDPNNQVSVSYINASGKTVATALAGSAPASLDPIPSYISPANAVVQNVQILKPQQFVFDSSSLKLTATTTYLNAAIGTTTNPAILSFNVPKLIDTYPGGSFQICSNCYYQLSINVRNDCGESIASQSGTVIGSAVSDCNAGGTYSTNVNVPLQQVGEYYITIELAFNNGIIDQFTDNFITQGQSNGYIERQFNYIKKRYLDSIDASGCYADCHTCVTLLGKKSDFTAALTGKFLSMNVDTTGSYFNKWVGGLYDTLSRKCAAIHAVCDTVSPCSAVQGLMVTDVSPGGQYALFDASNVAVEPSINVITGMADGVTANWRVVFPVLASTDSRYQAELITRDDGSITSPYDAGFTLADLIKYWKPSWGLMFLRYHPEYCQLVFCNNNSVYEGWDDTVTQVDSADSVRTIHYASALTYSHSNSSDWLLNVDPYFATGGPAHAYLEAMRTDLANYSTNVLNMPAANNKSLMSYVDYNLYCADPRGTINTATNPDTWTYCSPTDSCRVPDREWQSYRDMYLQLKQKYYGILRNASCGANCPVGQPLANNYIPGACPTVQEFAIQADLVNPASCAAGYQAAIVAHSAGAVGQAATVNIYYPAGYDNSSLTHSLAFTATDAQKSFCVPSNIPLSAVLIKSVTCGTGSSSGSTGSSSAGIGSLAVSISEQQLSDQPDSAFYCNGRYQNIGIVRATTSITLVDAAGNPTPNPTSSPIILAMKYSSTVQGSGGTGYFLTYISIYPGQSTGSYTYIKQANTSTLPDNVNCYDGYTSQDPYCVQSITGAPLTTASYNAWSKCSGFTTTIPPPPVVSTCPDAYSAKASRFPSVPTPSATALTAGQASSLVAATQASLQAQTNNICKGNADAWMTVLKPGLDSANVSQTVRDQLRARLIETCAAGGDLAHPMGASDLHGDLNPGSATYISFGDAIKAIVLNNPATGNPAAYFTPKLNPYLIESPYPYLPLAQVVSTTLSYSSPKLCTLLGNLSTAAAAHGQSLYNYLVATYHDAMTLSASDLAVLQKSCSNCKFIMAKDVTIPVFLDTAAKGCVTGGDFKLAKDTLAKRFGGTLDTTTFNYQTIYANYFNQRYGFALIYDTYKKYSDSLANNQYAMLCNTPPYTAATLDPYACIKSQMEVAVANGLADYADYINKKRISFRNDYISTCSAAQANAYLKASQPVYHYTLYYYDQADNLVRTVPPEGVMLVDAARFQWIDASRDSDPAACQAAFDSFLPSISTDKTAAFTSLSATLNNTNATHAVELWLYNPLNQASQLIQQTVDQNYMFQLCMAGTQLTVEVYSATPSTGAITYTLSNQFAADITSLMPLYPWQHVVIQSSNFAGGALQVYLNGKLLTAMTGQQATGCSWTVGNDGTKPIYPDNISTLKHMRLYSRAMTAAEIAANAADNCFLPSNSTSMSWYRFNVPLPGDPTTIAANTTDETKLVTYYPLHALPTTYAYNSTNQVVLQRSPDGGTNRFWYDLLSRLAISQNDKQADSTQYSYTVYEPTLGRITEVGQKVTANAMPYTDANAVGIYAPAYLPEATRSSFLASGTNTQITRTYYDAAPAVSGGLTGLAQNNLRKRVAATMLFDTQTGSPASGLYYNYDIDGNVKTLYRQMPGLGTKQVDYEYDLVSGKVNFVRYQSGLPDRFYYRYAYDAENRLTDAWSGTEALVDVNSGSTLLPGNKKLDAHYDYYLHGPLARLELGDQYGKVQGIDYAYTLQGWLKGVNSSDATAANDMGGDGATGHPTIPKDAYAYALNYYGSSNWLDYTPVHHAQPFSTYLATHNSLRQLYNGNITEGSMNIPVFDNVYWFDQQYTYDQLNRITSAINYHTTAIGAQPTAGNDYNESFTYDGNGNIKTLNRTGGTTALMDQLTYGYNYDTATGKLTDNKLNFIADAVPDGTGTDLKSQSPNNYSYDKIGNLTADAKNGVSNTYWTVYGKIKELTGASGRIIYKYDPAGERISKKLGAVTTYYVRDAQGNTLAVYDDAGSTSNWREQHLYGSSRLGLWMPNVSLGTDTARTAWQNMGVKQYELNNHLGNVMATITDRRLQYGADTTVTSYDPDIATAQNYYAFGSLVPGRSYTANNVNYRYGFNGKENDNDVKGTGNEQDYGMRIYDPRAGRFLSDDPLTKSYPWYTPYQFAGNTPIQAIDLDGAEPYKNAYKFANNSDPQLNLFHADNLIDMSMAKTASSYNALGWERNGSFFWQQYKSTPLGKVSLSEENLNLIFNRKTPIIDEQWNFFMKQFGNDGRLGEVVAHHHMNKGKYAVPIPTSRHVGAEAEEAMHGMSPRLGRVSQRFGRFLGNADVVLNIGSIYLDSPNSMLYTFHQMGTLRPNRAYPTNDPDAPGPYYEWHWTGKPYKSLREATFYNDYYETKGGTWRGKDQVGEKKYFDNNGKDVTNIIL